MKTNPPFTVYNASAGSGKTYTLVRDFLLILLSKNDKNYFKHILAITFTNKAAAEMKSRILENLECFSQGFLADMGQDIQQKLGLDKSTLQERSQRILTSILQDYSSFHITTIDAFTHKIVRSFSYDFGLNEDFDITLNSNMILEEAVDTVISQIGIDPILSKSLVQLSLKEAEDDKAWDIRKILYNFSKVLLNENHKKNFLDIRAFDISQIKILEKSLRITYKKLEKELNKIGKEGLEIIASQPINHNDFTYSRIPKHFSILRTDPKLADFRASSTLTQDIENQSFYAKSKNKQIKTTIDAIMPELLKLYETSKEIHPRFLIISYWLDSFFPMGILNYVDKALEQLKKDYNLVFISDFNEMIFEKIKAEPIPFIYERLGEKYKHFFIDEMQDTSVMQWKNLVPLIDNAFSYENALSTERGSLLLVGDPKQSIYRWRGSNPEQFISLSDADNLAPFHVEKIVKQLDTNYRSHSEIIDFNNKFFSFISQKLNHATYRDLYQHKSFQKENSNKGGYVQIDFVEKDSEIENSLLFAHQVKETILHRDPRTPLQDICILVRTKKEGMRIAEYLTAHDIDVISSDSLLLQQNKKIRLLIDTLTYLNKPNSETLKFEFLYQIYQHLKLDISAHDFITAIIKQQQKSLEIYLQSFGIDFSFQSFYKRTLYAGVEYLLRSFHLIEGATIYIQTFLEQVLTYQNQNGSHLAGFLDLWELQQEKWSVSIPKNEHAVQIMTFHKSKGLQFPMVIIPNDLDLYEMKDEKVWYTFLPNEETSGLSKIIIPYKTDLEKTDATGQTLFQDFREKQELDHINLLYVAMTRAEEQLYIITNSGYDSKEKIKNHKTSGFFTEYLIAQDLWKKEQNTYSFGQKKRPKKEQKKEKCGLKNIETIENVYFISHDVTENQIKIATNQHKLWETETLEAIGYGNLIHEMMAWVITPDDIPQTVADFSNQGYFKKEDKDTFEQILHNICNHANLKHFFKTEQKVLCEKSIYNPQTGQSIIPDRLVFLDEHSVSILDYKTGLQHDSHIAQVNFYAEVLTKMGYRVLEKYLVYITGTQVDTKML